MFVDRGPQPGAERLRSHRQRDRLREPECGIAQFGVGRSPAPATRPSRASRPTSASTRSGRAVQGRHDGRRSYRLDIYRLGYYGGMGARKVATVSPSASLPQTQPACLTNARHRPDRLRQLGRVGVVDGARRRRVGHLLRQARARRHRRRQPHRLRRPRRRAAHSDLLFQTSDTTWQAYNQYGGNSLYVGSPGRARLQGQLQPAVHHPRRRRREDWVFNAEYPMVRWLEANGYDVSYSTGVDTDRRGATCSQHKVFLSVGHDEYWSGAQRANVEAARDAGVNLAFFSGNEVFWKTRWENSIDGSGTPYRTLVCYKETHANAKIDPQDPPTWTGTWRDPRFSPPADGGRPENALTGHDLHGQRRRHDAIRVPAADGKHALLAQHHGRHARRRRRPRRCRPARSATSGTIDVDNGFRPAGLIRLSQTTTAGRRHAARLRLDLRRRHRHAHPDAVPAPPAARWCSAPAPCSGRGASTPTTTAARRAADVRDAAGDRQPVRRHGRAARDAAGRPGRRPRPPPIPLAPTSTITSPAANGATVQPAAR